MVAPRLKVVAGGKDPPPATRLHRRKIIVGSIVLGGLALLVWRYVDPGMTSFHRGVVETLTMVAIGAIVVRARWNQKPEREPDQIIVRLVAMKRVLLAGAAALAIVVALPRPAAADLSFGELTDGLDQAVQDLLESLFHWLLDPREVGNVVMPVPLPEPVIGDHVGGLPVSVNEMLEYDQERILDRTARVEALNAIVEEGNAASTNNADLLAALAVANQAPPISVASQQQIGNQATIAMGDAFTTMEQIWLGHLATVADERQLQENVRALTKNQDAIFAGLPEVAGGVQPVAGHVAMPW